MIVKIALDESLKTLIGEFFGSQEKVWRRCGVCCGGVVCAAFYP